jgi:methionyl-tRNA formyltransferase
MKNRVIFFGTPEFAVPILTALIDYAYNIVAVYTQPDKQSGRGQKTSVSPVKELALKWDIPVFQPESLKSPDELTSTKVLLPEIAVVAAYGKLIPGDMLRVPRFGFVNVHPSLLPKYRGATPIPAAILNGDPVTGVSIMQLDEGMDTGPVFKQRQVPVTDDDNGESLSLKLTEVGAELMMEILPEWIEGRIRPEPQDNTQASYTKPIAREDGKIDWRLGSTQIWRRIRAFYPWPGCYTTWQGKNLKILQAMPVAQTGNGVAGAVVPLDRSSGAAVGVECGDGVLGLLKVQLEGKRDMMADEFIRGQRQFAGSVLL